MSQIKVWSVISLATAALGLFSITRGANEGSSKKPATASGPPNPAPVEATVAEHSPVELALTKRVKLKFEKAPLKDVAATAAEISGVNVVLDVKAIDDAGVDDTTQFSFEADSIALGEGLRLLLAKHELNFIIEDDNVLAITSDTKAKEHTIVRVYDVHDLQRKPRNHNSKQRRPDGLIDIITSCIAPTSWAESGGVGAIRSAGGQLVVLQTAENHQQIVELLVRLRQVRDQPQKIIDAGGRVGLLANRIEATTRKLLEARQDFGFHNARFVELANTLSKRGIPTRLDPNSISDTSDPFDITISFQAKQIRVKTALRSMLREYGLTYMVDANGLSITSVETATTDVYPVGDLLDGMPERSLHEADDPYDQLIDLITTTVQPTTWADAGGTGSIEPMPAAKALVCSQTVEGHDGVCELLARLRAARRAAVNDSAERAGETTDDMVTRIYFLAVPPNAAKPEEDYVTAIRNLIEPKIWKDGGAYIGKVPGAIVARCSPAVHQQIRDLLDELNALQPASNGTIDSGVVPVVGQAAGQARF